MPPQPKPPGQRRRRNVSQPQWKQLPADGRQDEAPPLPPAEWLDSTREWWKSIWASPMATLWLDADVPALVRLAQMIDQCNQGVVSGEFLSEIRQLEDRFGLSPKARKGLFWEISQGAEVVDHPAAKRERKLRAVEG